MIKIEMKEGREDAGDRDERRRTNEKKKSRRGRRKNARLFLPQSTCHRMPDPLPRTYTRGLSSIVLDVSSLSGTDTVGSTIHSLLITVSITFVHCIVYLTHDLNPESSACLSIHVAFLAICFRFFPRLS
jgi:hypothetical protein